MRTFNSPATETQIDLICKLYAKPLIDGTSEECYPRFVRVVNEARLTAREAYVLMLALANLNNCFAECERNLGLDCEVWQYDLNKVYAELSEAYDLCGINPFALELTPYRYFKVRGEL